MMKLFFLPYNLFWDLKRLQPNAEFSSNNDKQENSFSYWFEKYKQKQTNKQVVVALH